MREVRYEQLMPVPYCGFCYNVEQKELPLLPPRHQLPVHHRALLSEGKIKINKIKTISWQSYIHPCRKKHYES